MFWFGRPSYLRWIAAAALVLVAAAIEFRPTHNQLYPFAAESLEPGDPLAIEWRTLPADTYSFPPLGGMVAAHALEQGDPITGSAVTRPIGVADGWWAVSLEVPTQLAPGTPTLLVLGQSEEPVPGTVVTSSTPDRFSATGPTALIAVPESRATAVAAAAAARQVVVMVAP